jgi:hypothetical protein
MSPRRIQKDAEMFLQSRSLLLAAALMAGSMTVAIAQNNPAANLGSNNSATASPGTADSKSMSGMNTADAGSKPNPAGNYSGSAMSTKPGSTGKTVVPGSTSTQASNSKATTDQRQGPQTTGGK